MAEKAKAELAQLMKELSDLLGKMTDRWPIRNGFDKFYVFMGGGESNQWSPAIYDGMVKIELPKDSNYQLMTDITNQSTN